MFSGQIPTGTETCVNKSLWSLGEWMYAITNVGKIPLFRNTKVWRQSEDVTCGLLDLGLVFCFVQTCNGAIWIWLFLLRQCQITLFLMITKLPENILNRIPFQILTTASDSSNSWFNVILKLCHQFHFPHPLLLPCSLPEMILFKKTVKLNVIDFWRRKLTSEAAPIDSLLSLESRTNP